MEKHSSTNLVPGAKEIGDRCRGYKVILFITARCSFLLQLSHTHLELFGNVNSKIEFTEYLQDTEIFFCIGLYIFCTDIFEDNKSYVTWLLEILWTLKVLIDFLRYWGSTTL